MLSEDDKYWLQRYCGKVERGCLYIMIFIILVTSFGIQDKLKRIETKLDSQQIEGE